ncbi:hypothetical protein L0F63_000246 [Massospora cicadina]|nr:hypothetical protein L0F63_000246 [Massospora cicadina]
MVDFPVIDLAKPNEPDSKEARAEYLKVAESLIDYGVLVVRDSRASEEYNSQFIDMMERYFEQPYDMKLKDARPQFHYQVGVTPEKIEGS